MPLHCLCVCVCVCVCLQYNSLHTSVWRSDRSCIIPGQVLEQKTRIPKSPTPNPQPPHRKKQQNEKKARTKTPQHEQQKHPKNNPRNSHHTHTKNPPLCVLIKSHKSVPDLRMCRTESEAKTIQQIARHTPILSQWQLTSLWIVMEQWKLISWLGGD